MPPTTLTDLTSTTGRIKRQVGQAPAKKPGGGVVRILLGALIVVLLGAGMFRMFSKPSAPSTVTVVAAAKDIPPGYRLGFRDLHYLTIPKGYITPDMVTTYPELVGRFSNSYLAMGEPILKDQLLPGTTPLSEQLGVNERAITLKLNDEALVDNNILPGDRIDVISTTAAPNGKKFTRTVCQDVLVLLSVPRKMLLSDKLRSTDGNKITLAVHPNDAEKLSQAADVGKIRILLRCRTNHVSYSLPGADDRDLLPLDALKTPEEKAQEAAKSEAAKEARQAAAQQASQALPPPPESPQPFRWMVEIFKGATKESHVFPSE